MKFLVQSGSSDTFPEDKIFKNTINLYMKFNAQYEELGLEKLKRRLSIEHDRYIDYYPFGNIDFISYWLKFYYDRIMQPIEVPKILRTEEFLRRDYKIVYKNDVPKHGRYCIKNVSSLKSGCFIGSAESWQLSKDEYKDDTLFSVSNEINILSEWRVYVIDGKIYNISNYDGDSMLFPDVTLINKMISLFVNNEDAPKDFSIDVGVTKKDTVVIELHPFAALGLYHNLWDADLIYAYKHGIEWYINNKYSLI